MDASTTVAITGILVAGLGTPSIGAYWALKSQRKAHEHDRCLNDLGELREVLDGASVALTAMGVVGAEMHAVRQGSPYPAEMSALMRDFWNSVDRLDGERLRVEIRLGSDDATVLALSRARDGVRGAGAIFVKGAITDDERGRAEEFVQAFWDGRREFVEQAKEAVGSRLSGDVRARMRRERSSLRCRA